MAIKLALVPQEIQALYTLCDQEHPERAGELFSLLSPRIFYQEYTREVFQFLCDYANDPATRGFPAWRDVVSDSRLPKDVRTWLKRETVKKTIKPHSDPKYLGKELVTRAQLRVLSDIVTDATRDISDLPESTDPVGILETYQKRIAGIAGSMVDVQDSITSIGTDSKNTLALLEEILSPTSEPYIPTGLKEFDRNNRGFNLGELAILAGQSGAGKSLLAGQLVRNQALAGYKIAMVGLEMSARGLLQRELARQTATPLGVIRDTENMTRPTKEKLIKAYKKLDHTLKSRGGCIEYFNPEEDLTIQQILYALKPMGYDAIYIDYVGLLGGIDGPDQWRALMETTRFAKKYASANNISVVLLAQLNDEGSLRQSKGMKNDAAYMWTWRMTDQDRADGKMLIKQEKNRFGPMDALALHVDWETMTVTSEEHQGNADDTVTPLSEEFDDSKPKMEVSKTWVGAGVDFYNAPAPLYRYHDLHDMDYWFDPEQGLCPAWQDMGDSGWVNTDKIYGEGYDYQKDGDSVPVGNYIVPESLRGDDYPADEYGRPLYDRKENTFLPLSEREELGFTGLSLNEREERKAKESHKPDDTLTGPEDDDFADDSEPKARKPKPAPAKPPESAGPISVEIGEENLPYMNTPESVFAYDPNGLVEHTAPLEKKVTLTYPVQGFDEEDEDYDQRVSDFMDEPCKVKWYEDVLGTLTLYREKLAAGTLRDKPNELYANSADFPQEIKEIILRKFQPKTFGDLGELPFELDRRLSWGLLHDDLNGMGVDEDDEVVFPMQLRVHGDDGFTKLVDIQDARELRHLLGIKCLTPAEEAYSAELGCPVEPIGRNDAGPTELKEPEEPAHEDIDPEEDVPNEEQEDDPVDTQPEEEGPEEKPSIFQYLREGREDPEGYNMSKDFTDAELDSVPDARYNAWVDAHEAKTIGDLPIRKSFPYPLSRFRDTETGQSINARTPIWKREVELEDTKTGEVETVKGNKEFRMLFNLRCVL